MSEWSAPPMPARWRLSDRTLRNLAVVSVGACVLATTLTMVWQNQTRTNRTNSHAVSAFAVGSASGSVELDQQIDSMATEIGDLRLRIDDEKTRFVTSIDDRDRARDQLALTQLHLQELQSRVNGTYAVVLRQGDTMASLNDCLRGVSRVLNLSAINADDLALAELFTHYDSCAKANRSIEAAG